MLGRAHVCIDRINETALAGRIVKSGPAGTADSMPNVDLEVALRRCKRKRFGAAVISGSWRSRRNGSDTKIGLRMPSG
jgi:hypothetical protein